MPKLKNYEIKTPIDGIKDVNLVIGNLSKRLGNYKFSVQNQKDIYYKINTGRLKLRIINGKTGELIHYIRKETKKIRVSNYSICKINDGENLHNILSKIFNVNVIVEKHRKIYIFGNIRIHLDKVKNLGEFLEFEVVYTDFKEARKQMKFLIESFNLDRRKFINYSYSDLLLNKQNKKGS